MKKLLINILSAISIATVTGCSASGDSSNNPSSPNQSQTANAGKLLTIHNQTTIPIINGTSSTAGFDIHNNSDRLINGIKLSAISNYPGAGDMVLLDPVSKDICSKIAAHSSCHVKVNVPQVNDKEKSGSIAINAKYNADGEYEIHGLVNFQYFDSEELSDGVHVLTDIKANGYGNHNGYATAYMYGGGKDKVYKIDAIQSKGLKVVNGDFIGKTIASGQVIPLEIKGASSVDKSYIDELVIISSDYSDNTTRASANAARRTASTKTANEYYERIMVEVLSQADAAASVVTSFNPRLDLSTNTSGVIYFHNNGNATINDLKVNFGENITANGSSDCTGALESGIVCTVPYKITSTISGNSTVKLSYSSAAGAATATSIVSWYNSNPIGILTIDPVITNMQFDKNESGLQVYNIKNIGGTTINISSVKANAIFGRATGEVLNDTCSSQKLAANESCAYTVAVKDTSPTNDHPEASGELETIVNGSYIDDKGKEQKTLVRGIIDYTSLIPQGVIVANVNPTGIASITANGKDSADRTITYTNVGNVPATNVSGALTTTSPLISKGSDTCSAKNTMAVGESCSISLKVGPTDEDIATAIESGVNYVLSAKYGAKAYEYPAGFQYQVLPAAIEIESIAPTAVNNNSGQGSASAPFIFSGAKPGQKMISFNYKNIGGKSFRINKVNLETVNPQLWQPLSSGADSCLQSQTNAVDKVLQPGDECSVSFVSDVGTNPYQLATPSITADLPIPVIEVEDSITKKVYEIQAKTTTGDNTVHATNNQGVVTSLVRVEKNGLLDASLVISNSLTNGADYSGLNISSQMQNLYGLAGTLGGTGAQFNNCADNGSTLSLLRTNCSMVPNADGVATAKAVYPLNKTLVGSGSILNALFSSNLTSPQWVGMQNYAQVVNVNAMAESLKPAHLYASSKDGSFRTCPIENGVLAMDKCNKFSTNIASTTGFLGVTINESKAYIGNWAAVGATQQVTSIYSCSLNKATGVFSVCSVAATASGNGFTDPKTLLIHSGMAYLLNSRDLEGTISVCPVQTGSFWGKCVNYSTKLKYTTKMAINGSKIYITGSSTSTSGAGDITVCSIASNGSLSDCNVTNAREFSDVASNIAVDDFSAYITNEKGNYMAVCQLGADGELTDHCNKVSGSDLGGFAPLRIAQYGSSVYLSDITGNSLSVCKTNVVTGGVSDCKTLDNDSAIMNMRIFSW